MAPPSLETGEFKRGPGGRPTQAEAERRHMALLETAMRLFLERGLDAVSIDEIAKRAGVAKRFLYARYRDKSELFAAAVEHMIVEKLQELHAFQPPRRRVEFGLVEFGRKLRETATAPDGLALMRLFISAAPKFPGLVQRFYDRNRRRGTSEVQRILAFYAERGEIELKEPQLMAEQFAMSVAGFAQRLALFGVRETPEEEERRLRAAVGLFLDGCRTSPGQSRTTALSAKSRS
ncbi:MAG TPA: TetR/AcrR family transcriptional regulator [Xanthobacteraceae bacterium]|jgi:TetR/AcrR family transcriptional repressor of mexJK operon|nr:TetR/AcrR family transcriptional regulator [Xanthobacteraceae bacterium]